MGPIPMIKKAIVAVTGAGTRFLPATKTMPKEMLPIVDKPIIQLVVEELVAAGIQDIILVTKWDKKPLEDHFDHNCALANELRDAGKMEQLEEITRISGIDINGMTIMLLRSAHTSVSIHREEHSSAKYKNMTAAPKEAHNGRQRRKKGQRQGPETEGEQTRKRSKR